jgi:hypothetical protein
MSLKTLVIGAGTKGALYPDERLTHAWAFSRDGFELVGFCDTNSHNLNKAYDRWKKPVFMSLQAAIANQEPDVVTVAVSDTAHYDVLKAIAEQEHKPRLVFTEKPFCQNFKQASEIAELYKAAGITLSVNFSRRFLPEYQGLQIDPSEVFGVSSVFTKGLHNFCHLTDLMLLWDIEDFSGFDIDRETLNVFEIEIYGIDQKISILDHGAQIRIIPTKPREDYPADTILDYEREQVIQVDLADAMRLAASNIWSHLNNDIPLISTVENALNVMEACEQWHP